MIFDDIHRALADFRIARHDEPSEIRMNRATAEGLDREFMVDPWVSHWDTTPIGTVFSIPIKIYENIPDGIAIPWSSQMDAPSIYTDRLAEAIRADLARQNDFWRDNERDQARGDE